MTSERLCKDSILSAAIEVADEFEKELYGSNKYDEIKKWGKNTSIEFPPTFSIRLYAHLIEFIQRINDLPIQNEMIKYYSQVLKNDVTELYTNSLAVMDYPFLVKMMLRISTIARECISPCDIVDKEEEKEADSNAKEWVLVKAKD